MTGTGTGNGLSGGRGGQVGSTLRLRANYIKTKGIVNMNHSKRYKRTGYGAELLCGNRVVADNETSYLVNWQLTPCRFCGIDVVTTGHSPDTDRVMEIARA